MTSSSSPSLERAVDAMVVVYSLLQGHPASIPCEQFLRNHSGWFTTALALLETKAVLTKVYGVDPGQASQKLTQFAGGPIHVVEVDSATALAALGLADNAGLDLMDAILLQVTRQLGAPWLATEDHRLAQACGPFGITPQAPLNLVLRQQVAAWEATHLPPKGLPRVLRRVHDWLSQNDPQVAQAFWSQSGGGSHLP